MARPAADLPRPQATPTTRRRLERVAARLLPRRPAMPRVSVGQPRALRLGAYGAVATLMLSLPVFAFGTTGGRAAVVAVSASDTASELATVTAEDRAVAVARGREILASLAKPATVTSEAPAAISAYTVQDGDTIEVISRSFHVSAQTIGFNNGVADARSIHKGDVFRIPPMDAAIYTVKDGDTVDSVAAHFKVDAKTISDTNRLYFEPENFATGKEILVPEKDSEYPNYTLKDAPPPGSVPVTSESVAQPIPAGPHRLAWPVAGIITQYFWYGHTGVDIAAPFGTGIGASDAGVVSAAGWVAVGGLRVCVKHDWGMETCYYHTSTVLAQVGQHVDKGTIIARIGLTGVTTGPHVHWEARYNGVLVNALLY